jgi:hypothetical protein
MRGVRVVTNVGRDAMDAIVLSDVQCGSGRRKRAGLAPQWQVPSLAVIAMSALRARHAGNREATETTKPGLSGVSTQ